MKGMMDMLCENCKKNQATTYFKQTVNGKTKEIFLCSECAAKAGLSSPAPAALGLEDLLLNLLGGRSVQVEQKVCPVCGISEREIVDGGRVGCAECYNTFSDRLGAFIEKVHQNKPHVGKRPKNLASSARTEQNPLEDLRRRLQSAIQAEDFEQAAVLRDRIRKIENEKQNGKES